MTARDRCVIAYKGALAPWHPGTLPPESRLCCGTARPRPTTNHKRVLCAHRGPGGAAATGAVGSGIRQARAQRSQQLPLQLQAAKDDFVPILFCCSHNVQKPRTPGFETGKDKTPIDPEETMTKTFSLVPALVTKTNDLFDEYDQEKLLVFMTINFFPMCLFVINLHL